MPPKAASVMGIGPVLSHQSCEQRAAVLQQLLRLVEFGHLSCNYTQERKMNEMSGTNFKTSDLVEETL